MTPLPAWLPQMLSVNPWTDKTFDDLYTLFKRDFVENKPRYRSISVWFFPDMEDGKERIFWHLTHREDKERGERLSDFRRSERLPWARPMLENPDEPEVLDWDYEEGNGSIKTYVWLKDFDYLVLLKKYPDGGRRIVTAYWIEYGHEKRKLLKKYQRRIAP
ncbi:MAG: hypothetical protein V1753_07980 [Pseudomonadota bacterium]